MNLQEALTNIELGTQTAFKVTEAVGGGKTLTVEARRLLPEEPRAPVRAESPARTHTFYAAESLAAYLERYGNEHTVIFADHQGETIYAVVDETSPQGFEVETMRPQIHPLWKPWADLAGRPVELETFARFVSENRRAILKPDGRDLAMTLSQVRATVSTTIDRGRGKSAVNAIRVETEIQGVRKAESVELPDEITLNVPLYVGTERKTFDLDLCVEASASGKVTVLVTAGTVAEARVAAFEEMLNLLHKRLDAKKVTITLGKPSHAAWAYLPEMAETRPTGVGAR